MGSFDASSWWWAAGSVALSVALVFLRWPIPRRATAYAGLRRWAWRWGHGVCWVLLASSFTSRALRWAPTLSDVLAALGGMAYVCFLVAIAGRDPRDFKGLSPPECPTASPTFDLADGAP